MDLKSCRLFRYDLSRCIIKSHFIFHLFFVIFIIFISKIVSLICILRLKSQLNRRFSLRVGFSNAQIVRCLLCVICFLLLMQCLILRLRPRRNISINLDFAFMIVMNLIKKHISFNVLMNLLITYIK